jgi:hypothetical protein
MQARTVASVVEVNDRRTGSLAYRSPAGLRRVGRAVRGAGLAGASLAGDLAAHAGKATARSTANNTEYPSAHLQPAGSPWPWRPATLFTLTIAAAIGVTRLPPAAARRHRP